jgi:hypothetical protein
MFHVYDKITGNAFIGGHSMIEIAGAIEKALREVGAKDDKDKIPSSLPMDFIVSITIEECP